MNDNDNESKKSVFVFQFIIKSANLVCCHCRYSLTRTVTKLNGIIQCMLIMYSNKCTFLPQTLKLSLGTASLLFFVLQNPEIKDEHGINFKTKK